MNTNYEKEIIIDLIENHTESEYLDFKQKPYTGDSLVDFVKDTIAFVNSSCFRDKYIIFGVEDKTNRQIGINTNEMPDSAILQKILNDKVEPQIDILIGTIEYQGNLFGFVKIPVSNTNKPYILKDNYEKGKKKINKGASFIRKGSFNDVMNRSDLDRIYSFGRFEVSFYHNFLVAEPLQITRNGNLANTYGLIDIVIKNFSQRPVTIDKGKLDILDPQGNLLTEHVIVGIRNVKESNFHSTFLPNYQEVHTLFTNFSSDDCVKLNVDYDGTADDVFRLNLILEDLNGEKYETSLDECHLKAKGDILHKIKLKYDRMRSYLKANFKNLINAIESNNYKTIEKIMQCEYIDFNLIKADHVLNAQDFPETHYIYKCIQIAVKRKDEKLLEYFKKIGLAKKIISLAEEKETYKKPHKEFLLWDDIMRKKHEEFINSRQFDN